MKKLPFGTVCANFVQEWLLPRLGSAYAIYQVANIGIGSAYDSENPDSVTPFLNIINNIGSTLNISIGIFIGTLFLLVNIVKLVVQFFPPVRFWFKFSTLGGWSGAAVGFLLGTLLLPITLWLTAELKLPLEQRPYGWIIFYVAIYILLNFAMYYMKMDDSNDSKGAVFWSVHLNRNQSLGDVVAELDRIFADINWVGKCEVLSNSQDGHLLVEIPILYNISKWPEVDISRFRKFYKDSTKVLKDKGFNVVSKSQSNAMKDSESRLIKKERRKS